MTTTITPTPLHEWQFERWTHLPTDYRHTAADGRRMVMVGLERATALVPWYGPSEEHHTGTRARVNHYRAFCACTWLADYPTEAEAEAGADAHR